MNRWIWWTNSEFNCFWFSLSSWKFTT